MWVAATVAAAGLLTIPALAAGAGPAAAVTATGNVHTTAISSPVLAARNYLVNLAIGVSGITPGSVVLCGLTSGPGGAIIGDTSMNELPVGAVDISH
jgi:hypothetical protein